MKKILKVLYICFAAVVTIIIGIGVYYSYTFDDIVSQSNKCVEEEDYAGLGGLYSYWFEKDNICPSFDCDKYNLGIQRGGYQKVVNTYKKNTTATEEDAPEYVSTSVSRVYDCYYLYLTKVKFDISNCTTGSKENPIYTNKAGIRFYSGENTFDYLFDITSEVNKSMYKSYPATVEEAIVSQRELTKSYNTWNVFNIVITTKDVEVMNLGGTIDGVAVLDNAGEIVGSKINVNLDFTGKFYDDFKEFRDVFNEYINVFDTTTEEDKQAREDANKAFDDFYNGENGYKARFTNMGYGVNTYVNSSLTIWKSIGTAALFVLATVLLYILIFHFKWVKSLIIKDGNNNGRYRVSNKKIAEMEAKRQNTIKADVKEVKPTAKSEAKPAAKPVTEEKPAVVETPVTVPVVEEAKAEEPAVAEETKTEEPAVAEEVALVEENKE